MINRLHAFLSVKELNETEIIVKHAESYMSNFVWSP